MKGHEKFGAGGALERLRTQGSERTVEEMGIHSFYDWGGLSRVWDFKDSQETLVHTGGYVGYSSAGLVMT